MGSEMCIRDRYYSRLPARKDLSKMIEQTLEVTSNSSVGNDVVKTITFREKNDLRKKFLRNIFLRISDPKMLNFAA